MTLGGNHRQPRAVYKYWAQVRLCGQAATYSSSLRRPVDGAFTVLRQSGGHRRYVTENCTLSSTLLSWHRCGFPWTLRFSSCSTLIRWSTFVVQVLQVRVQAVRRQSRSHSCSPFLGPGRSHARCVQRQMPMVDVLMQFIDISHVPVIMQRRCTGEVPQIQLSRVTVDIPVVQQRRGIFSSADDGGDEGLVKHFASFFALLRLSRS